MNFMYKGSKVVEKIIKILLWTVSIRFVLHVPQPFQYVKTTLLSSCRGLHRVLRLLKRVHMEQIVCI